MQVDVNGAAHRLRGKTLADLIDEMGFDGASVATALNGAFVPRGSRANTALAEGAKVEVLAPMQGG